MFCHQPNAIGMLAQPPPTICDCIEGFQPHKVYSSFILFAFLMFLSFTTVIILFECQIIEKLKSILGRVVKSVCLVRSLSSRLATK